MRYRSDAAKSEVKPDPKPESREAKAVEPKLNESKPDVGKAEAAKPEAKESGREPTKTAESKSAPAAGKGWQDPPADGARKNVRVIGGATVVPGGTGEAAGSD